MLLNSFVHIQGIGRKTELRLWSSGYLTWFDLLKSRPPFFSQESYEEIRLHLNESLLNLNNPGYFARLFKKSEYWRLYGHKAFKPCFLDIETFTSHEKFTYITVIGLYNGDSFETYIDGKNLNDFELAVAEYDIIITYGGSNFDIPIIRKSFPSITLPPIHIDLYHVLKKCGIKGGLKKIEPLFGIERYADIKGMNGFDAMICWKNYLNGSISALDLLIRYNEQDCISLKPIMEWAYKTLEDSYKNGYCIG